jgi:hypothetical protein
MTSPNKKPGTTKRPGKNTASQSIAEKQKRLHRVIAAQSAKTLAAHKEGRNSFWHPGEYPELWGLLQAAKREAQSLARLRGYMVFSHAGKKYAARFTNLDRIIVHDRVTDEFIASTGVFQL